MLTVSVPQTHDFEVKTYKVGVPFVGVPTPSGGCYNCNSYERSLLQRSNPTKNCLPFLE